jgi:hypothetical protein
MNNDLDLTMERHKVEAEQGWREEMDIIPWIKFPAHWEVQVIPPFGNASVRFRVKLPSGRIKSVYLDTRSALGLYLTDSGDGLQPYWEVYPVQGDTGRCHKDDVDELLKMIEDES